MISIQTALELVQKNLPERQSTILPLEKAFGKIISEKVISREPSPRYTNSAMDGFAVRWEDVQHAGQDQPVSLRVVGESQAGIPYDKPLQPGEAIRISTGGMLCEGADTIVPVEETEPEGDTVRVLRVFKKHQHVRFQGEEFPEGALLLKQGMRLSPPHVALLAGQGITDVPVYRTPKVSVIVTGTELMPYHAGEIAPWQIRESNGIMLHAAVHFSGGQVVYRDQVGDDFQETVAAVRRALEMSDVIIFSGGVSVGKHDLVKRAAAECGFETIFWKVKQKPGKPLFFARHEKKLFFGLPGNPVSAYMCYTYYLHPLFTYLGGGEFAHPYISGEAGETIRNKIARAHLMRVSLTHRENLPPLVTSLPKQGSHMLTTLTGADGFVVLEENESIPKGEMVRVYTLS